jgi:DNA invertase Pin-like site-specific DNA recombinase
MFVAKVGDAMNYGYARVSTRDQDFAGQVAELKAAGCEKVVSEKASGARGDRVDSPRPSNN